MADAVPEAAAAPDAAATAAAEGGGGNAYPNPAVPSAAELAALVQALRGGNAAAQRTAADAMSKLVESFAILDETDECARICDALVELGAIGLLLDMLSGCSPDDERAQSSANALEWLTDFSSAARQAMLTAGGMPVLLRIMQAETRSAPNVTELTADIFGYCMQHASVRDACVADADFNRQAVAVLGNKGMTGEALDALCDGLDPYLRHGAAARNALRRAQCLPALASRMLDLHDVADYSCSSICGLVTYLQNADGQTAADTHAALYDAGIYAACTTILSAAMSGASRGKTFREARTFNLVARILITAFEEFEALRPALRQYVLVQPKALAGMAHAARSCTLAHGRKGLVGFLMKLRDDDGLRQALPGLWLLDAHFAACAVLRLRHSDTALVRGFVAQWRTASCLQAVAHPLPQQALPAAVSLACLSTDHASFRKLLASGTRLDILCTALVAAASRRCSEMDAEDASSQQPTLWWQLLVFRDAIQSAVKATRLAALAAAAGSEASADDELSAKLDSYRGVTLSASDVNVRRRDSTVLLIGGEPFYAHGAALEARSTVLADVLSDAETLDPIALPLPADVPADKHYALFRVAVEHTYTGSIAADMSAAELPSLFFLADHLQMDSLCAWCVERITPLLVPDARMLEAVWVAALARSCDALCDACATAWFVASSTAKNDLDHTTLLDVLARMQAACGADVPLSAQLARVLRAALLARDAGAAA
jgi:hypothetical protein